MGMPVEAGFTHRLRVPEGLFDRMQRHSCSLFFFPLAPLHSHRLRRTLPPGTRQTSEGPSLLFPTHWLASTPGRGRERVAACGYVFFFELMESKIHVAWVLSSRSLLFIQCAAVLPLYLLFSTGARGRPTVRDC